jgi:predicted Zn-dependent peptidase
MKRLIAVLLLCGSWPLAAQAPAEPPKTSVLGRQIQQFTYPDLSWKIPEVGKEIRRETLKNGLVVYLYPDRTLPIINVSLVVKGGGLYEPASEDLLASTMGSFLTMDGTPALTYEQLTEELETRSASLNAWMGDETGSIFGRSLTEHFPRLMELLRDVAVTPAFREEKLELIKKRQKEAILRQKDYPDWIADTLFSSKLYGDHPYGRISRVARVDAITRDEIVRAHRRYLVPNRAYLAVSGDIDAKQTLALVKKLFGDWKPSTELLPALQRVSDALQPGYYLFEKDIPQANIQLGHLATKRPNPDEFALWVMNAILGGEAFKSRLDTRVRSDEGLAYSVGSWFSTGSLETGAFGCYAQTKNERAFRTITIMKEIMSEMVSTPPRKRKWPRPKRP